MKMDELMSVCVELLKQRLKSGQNNVGQKRSPLELNEKVDFSLPYLPIPEADLIDDMKSYLEYTPNTMTPNFQNQLFSGLNPYSMIGDWISTFTNSTMATYEVSPFATLVEKELVKHLSRKVGWNEADGIMVTGGSNANLYGMLVARNTMFPKTKTEGMNGLKLVAFVSEEAHYSFDKAVNVLGMGLNSLKKVPSDDSGKMIPAELKRLILLSISQGETPYFVAATAGTTVLGSYDPIDEISLIAHEFGLWFHVDGAWGGSVILSTKNRHLMNGIQAADSFAVDTHKMLGTGLMSSFFLTKHQEVLRRSNHSGGGDYIFHETDTTSYDTGPSSLQCGRRVDALKVWLMWRSLGDCGIEKMIDDFFENASYAKQIIKMNPSVTLINDPEMLNICFTYKNEKTDVKKMRERLLREGCYYVNISTRKGKTFFRMILVNPLLTKKNIADAIDKIISMENDE